LNPSSGFGKVKTTHPLCPLLTLATRAVLSSLALAHPHPHPHLSSLLFALFSFLKTR
jgi:hypothetical protein